MRIKIAELFAGVGGFREAVESSFLQDYFEVSWSNQWEPSESSKRGDLQSANQVYIAKFGGAGHYTDDIHKITDSEKKLPDDLINIQMIVGGFPCQDYSVAKPKNAAKGIRGPKGVLWWSIERILRDVRPSYALLENVDRLINSPSTNRGRDFAVILKGLDNLGYIVEWRVVNAADYGFPQKRRRTFILAYSKNSPVSKKLGAARIDSDKAIDSCGVLASALPCRPDSMISCFDLTRYASDDELALKYKAPSGKSPFCSAGFVVDGKVWTKGVKAIQPDEPATLRHVLLNPNKDTLPTNCNSFRIPKDALFKWAYAKGRKNEPRRKSAVVASFIKSELRGSEIVRADVAKAVKQMPCDLKMDASFTLTVDKKTVSVTLAREEINYRLALALNTKDAISNRPNAITREQIELARSDAFVWAKVEESAVAIAADRAASLLGLKGKEQLRQITNIVRPHAIKAVQDLVMQNETFEFFVSGQSLKLNRDTLATHSFAYGYKEGGLPFPDCIDRPGRTIITSEGGASVSRFKHVICETCASNLGAHKNSAECVAAGNLRRLYPEELERMNGFSDKHSKICRELGISDGRRAFFMGNALVVGAVKRILETLVDLSLHQSERRRENPEGALVVKNENGLFKTPLS
jgi:DNA (cytosine-5)-methyltransferase 1